MTIHCPTCHFYRETKLKDWRKLSCSCGGKFERIQHIGNGLYKNFDSDIFKLEPPKCVPV